MPRVLIALTLKLGFKTQTENGQIIFFNSPDDSGNCDLARVEKGARNSGLIPE